MTYSTVLLVLLAASFAVADAPPPDRLFIDGRVEIPEAQPQPAPPDAGKPVHQWNRATDDWGGARPDLEQRGLSLNASFTLDAASNLRGGVNTNGGAVIHLFQLNATVDLEKAAGLAGGVLFANVQTFDGDSISADAGDLQGVSGIEDPGRTQLAEIWYEQTLLDERLTLTVGKIDANSRFAAPENGGEFVNGAFGLSPTVNLPTYPDPAFGLVVLVEPTETCYLAVGVFDGAAQEGIPTGSRGPRTVFGAPADLSLIAETGYRWTTGRVGVGVWHHTGTFDRFDGGTDDGASGVYAVLDQTLGRDDLAGFVQLGLADEAVSEVWAHLGIGVQWTGPLPGRQDDVTGLAVTAARLSDDAGFVDDFEITTELFYKLQLTPFFSIKPDLQYIHNPGGVEDDALVGLVRVNVDF